MSGAVERALALWGLQEATRTFVAGRENAVYRVTAGERVLALRLRRPGYRSAAELTSELRWLEAMAAEGVAVPRPVPSLSGAMLERVDDGFVDLAGWMPGRPLGRSGRPLEIGDRTGVFRRLGGALARLHTACDRWAPPADFTRCRWDAEGLLGEAPVWGRFWEHPGLSAAERDLFSAFRGAARAELDRLGPRLDFGLIHADPVRENVLIDGETTALIDFDDGGWGFRLFDLATALIKNRDEADYPALQAALIAGYLAVRPIDCAPLSLFVALRAASYVGWVVPRRGEPGGAERSRRFIASATALCRAHLDGRG